MSLVSHMIRRFSRTWRAACSVPVASMGLDTLEDRRLLSLIPVTLEYPQLDYNNNGTMSYDATAQLLKSDATPMGFRMAPGSTTRSIIAPKDFLIQARVDHSGSLIGGVDGNDLEIIGSIDVDADGKIDFTGTLLTGEITRFGYSDEGTSSDLYAFQFTPTGGSMRQYFVGKDIGITMTSELSTFAGSFAANFGGKAKGSVGPTAPLLSSIAGNVYYDANNNGKFETGPSEYGISGTQVQLAGTNIDGVVVNLPTTTNPDGSYKFEGLRAGTYTLTETQPAGYLDGKDTIGTPGGATSNDQFTSIALGAGVHGVQNNFGELLAASLGDRVWFDANLNGQQDDGELGAAGVTVKLSGTDDLGNPVSQTTITDGNGLYLFDNLWPGSYWVEFVKPAGSVFTLANSGADVSGADVSDSDADRTNGLTGRYTLVAGQAERTVDAGLVKYSIDLEKYVKAGSTPSSGGEGLTPGFWKQTQHFSYWVGYDRADSFNDIFGVNDPDDPTLLEALSRGGGEYKALGRHAVAGLLNAAATNVSYLYGISDVIAMVRQAYVSGGYEHAKNLLMTQNELEGDPNSGGKGIVNELPGVGEDADAPAGLVLAVGTPIIFTYVATNTGEAPLSVVSLIDDNATPGDTLDDFTPAPVVDDSGHNIGDINQNGLLDPEESWQYTASAVVTAGQHTNIGVISAVPVVDEQGQPLDEAVSDSDPANWYGGVLPPAAQSSLSGYVYVDLNDNGEIDFNEDGIANATVTLTGTDELGHSVTRTTTTDANGYYLFDELAAGKYQIAETQPAGFNDGKDTIGSLGGAVANDLFSEVIVEAGEDGMSYNFGEKPICVSPTLHSGQTATIGFWQNKNGQALIRSLNGGGCSKKLGTWLATNFPRMFGSLKCKTNDQVASYFVTRFKQTGMKLEAQALAVALAIYATDSDLAGGTMAAKYGFEVSAAGTGAATFSVGDNGGAFGVANGTVMSIYDILKTADTNNVFSGTYAVRTMANSVLDAINNVGDIC